MGTLLAILLTALSLMVEPAQQSECFAVAVVRNGLAAWDSGTTQIGHYTDRASYRAGGVEYIRLACGDTQAEAFAVSYP